jgi:hypothetical protein
MCSLVLLKPASKGTTEQYCGTQTNLIYYPLDISYVRLDSSVDMLPYNNSRLWSAGNHTLTLEGAMTSGCQKARPGSYECTADQSATKAKRPSLDKMSDAELLRFGIVSRYECSQGTDKERSTSEVYALQLAEVQKEWAIRFTKLPLSATFEPDEQVS